VRVGNDEGLVLDNKKAIINKRENENWNIEIFEPIFKNVKKR